LSEAANAQVRDDPKKLAEKEHQLKIKKATEKFFASGLRQVSTNEPPQKSSIYPQNSSVYLQYSLMYTQKESRKTFSRRGCARYRVEAAPGTTAPAKKLHVWATEPYVLAT